MSAAHIDCMEKWKYLGMGLKKQGTIDTFHQLTLGEERRTWRDILQHLMGVILWLCKQGLSLYGHREELDLEENRGNFLELIEYTSNYDPILREHYVRIKTACPSEGRIATYLSPQTQNEFITLMGNHVRERIVADIKKAKYYGILCTKAKYYGTPLLMHHTPIRCVRSSDVSILKVLKL